MKRFSSYLVSAAAGAAVLLAISTFTLAHDGTSRSTVQTAKQSPFYCDQGALDPARRKRHFDVLGPALVAKRTAVHELPDGYEFQFPSDAETYQQATEYVDGERLCCPFFEITVRVTPEGGPMWVRFTGRPGTKQFIQADGAEWIAPVPPGA